VKTFQHDAELQRDLELEKFLSVRDAATRLGISPDTLKRVYPHLIRKISPRRNGVKMRDTLNPKAA
jgi:hypothetical protein